MNVPRTYISKVEMGRVMPTLETLGRFAAALDISVTHLLSDGSELLRDDAIGRIMDDPFLTEIAQVAGRLNAVHRALILRAIRDAASDHHPATAAMNK
jgi:transcriptional regulator with XRE-family HTH domain